MNTETILRHQYKSLLNTCRNLYADNIVLKDLLEKAMSTACAFAFDQARGVPPLTDAEVLAALRGAPPVVVGEPPLPPSSVIVEG